MSNEILNLINQARIDARNEGITRFLGKNKKLIFRLILVILVIGISFFCFRIYQKSNQEKFSTILHQSMIDQQVGNIEKAKENLQKIVESASAPSGVKSLASLRYAAFLLAEGKQTDAAELYLKVSNCSSCDDYIQNLAAFLAVKVWMSNESELQKNDLAERIEKIENKTSVLRYHIAEQRAFLEMQKGNLEKSYQIFEMISKNPESSQGLKTSAEEGMQMAISQGYEPKTDDAK